MEEIEEIHGLTLEWGVITNLTDRISIIEDKIEGGWPELVDMVADAITQESTNKNPVEVFFHLYGFLFHLYYRVKRNPERRPFNQFSHVSTYDGSKKYRLQNYNYDLYKWAIKKGATDEIDNNVICIPANKLTDKEQRAFDRRCK